MNEIRLLIACLSLVTICAIMSCTKIVLQENTLRHDIQIKKTEAIKTEVKQ